MQKWFAAFILMAVLLAPVRANAQSALVVNTLGVAVWPEYDTPTVLVIYKISLSSQTTLPAEITVRLPAAVQKPYTVAVGNTPDTVTDQGVKYNFQTGADFASLTITATAPSIQVEYYDPGLTKIGASRQFVYEWPGDFAVNSFSFELRQPLQASNLKVEPALAIADVDAQGFQFSNFKQANVKEGQKLTFSISYQRSTDAPSTSSLQVESSAPLNQPVTGEATLTPYLPYLLGGLGVILLLIAGWVYYTSGSSNRASSKMRKRHVVSGGETASEDAAQVHCSQCGKRAQPNDRFCRACGTRIRRSGA